ncbi:hypothetical protein [Spirochaeta isovalerica]|uniref:Vacuolar-type H+-ATPase subunit I/STV1 n=1 Tax=Spirochaeta isovalerica TaxID=150 RepID=A0A841R813_9SPIO|nr:hypothetical protein [Spirochaeta isovalerica]MBB6478878.1 vacuolar-type H+-ATPase subunit I/STV1 [Spirochaeta isovalerica]
MKKRLTTTMLLVLALTAVSGTNLDNIYGKNDLDYSKSRGDLYGNNFGSILDYDTMPPRQIDIQNAENEIESLRNDIAGFREDIRIYENRGDEDRSKKSEIAVVLGKIDILLIELKSTSAQLYSAKANQTDSVIRQKLQDSIEENRQQIYDLTNRRSELVSEREMLLQSIETADRFVTLNNLFIRKSNSRIAYLESCIDYSNRETDSVDTLLEKSTSYQNEVDNLINVSF